MSKPPAAPPPAPAPAGAPAPDHFPFAPRWSAVVPTLVVVGAVGAFFAFFLDGIVERALERAGTAANDARVELDGVDISFLRASVTLSRLQVTDPDAPMTNALEVARMRFKLAPKPLFWKKVVIEDASIEGVRTGTPRKRSGALPKRAKVDEAEGPGLGEKAADLGLAAWDNLKDKYDPRKLQPEDLASYRKAKEEQVHLKAVADTWEARVDAVQAADLDDRVKAFAERVKTERLQGLEGVKKVQEMLKEAKAIRNDAQAARDGFKAIKTDLSGEIDRAKAAVGQIDELRRQDVAGALAGVNEAFSVGGVTQGILGPRYGAKLRHVLGLIRKVRAKIPQKKAGAAPPPPPPARKGVDVRFPFRHAWPAFHLVKSGVSGQTQGGREWEGTIRDVSSDPKLLGRPAVLDVAGRKSRDFALKVVVDHTKDTPREAIDLLYGGIPLAGMALGDAGGPVSVASGTGKVTADIEARGEAVSGTVAFTAAPIALSHALAPGDENNRLKALIHDVLTSLKQADVTFRLSDTISSPNIKVESSVDGQIKDAVQAAVRKELEAIKAQTAARVAELVDGEAAKLKSLVDGKAGAALAKAGLKDKQIAKAEDAIKTAIDDLQKKGAGSVLPTDADGKPKLPGDLKKLFKKK